MSIYLYIYLSIYLLVAPARVYLRVPGEMTGVQGGLVAAAGEELEVECVAGKKQIILMKK